MTVVDRTARSEHRYITAAQIRLDARRKINTAAELLSRISGMSVTSESTPDELEEAFVVAGRRAHPDNGGSQADFTAVVKARIVLSGPRP